eukprot:TRINITY_DN1556_c0_g1_i6.p1 TRINITY_DN1556_c0_g1~~TRINITY_DN1556_c0_g1_i6.p1  ORF type:complete len:358 (-),score=71.98 TRINITY_DN1556_c0_g1_i6:85-1158(-)
MERGKQDTRQTKKQRLKEVAKETLEILSTGVYTVSDQIVDIRIQQREAERNTILYGVGAFPHPALDDTVLCKKVETSFQFLESTTLEAAIRLCNEGSDPGVLNFASAKNPGGGFIKGSVAQEESLARNSGLYGCLTQPHVSKYYNDNKNDSSGIYTHNIIYSPSVPVFRDEISYELVQPTFISFITAPAVNFTIAQKRVEDACHILNSMLERMDRVLAIAALNSHVQLVLGAWGCGVFGNDPNDVALMWRKFLVAGKYQYTFEKIVFAVPDERILERFRVLLDPQKHFPEVQPRILLVGDNKRARRGEGGKRGEKQAEKERGRGKVGRGGNHNRGDRGKANRKHANVQQHNRDSMYD